MRMVSERVGERSVKGGECCLRGKENADKERNKTKKRSQNAVGYGWMGPRRYENARKSWLWSCQKDGQKNLNCISSGHVPLPDVSPFSDNKDSAECRESTECRVHERRLYSARSCS